MIPRVLQLLHLLEVTGHFVSNNSTLFYKMPHTKHIVSVGNTCDSYSGDDWFECWLKCWLFLLEYQWFSSVNLGKYWGSIVVKALLY